MLLYEAYQQVGISIASLAYYCGPVIVMILSPFLFRETLTWPKIAGFFNCSGRDVPSELTGAGRR